MKKNYAIYLAKVSHRTIAYVFLTALSFSVLLYSCRKIDAVPNEYAKPPIDIAAVITKNDLLNWYDDLPIVDQNNLNATIGLTSGNGKLPFPLQWDKAQQRIIKGKHVVKVPVGVNALIVFEKQGNNGPLTSCIYKWEDNTNKGKAYSGRVLMFNFQNYSFIGQEFQKNKKIGTIKIHVTDDITPDDLKKAKEALRTPTASNYSKTNSLKTQSFLGDLLNIVLTNLVKAVEAVGCTLANKETHWGFGATNYLANGGATTVGAKGSEKLTCGPDNLVNLSFSTDPNDPAPDDGKQIPAGDDFITIGMSNDGVGSGGDSSGGNSSGGSSSGGNNSGGSSSGSGGSSYNPLSNLSRDFWSALTLYSGGLFNIDEYAGGLPKIYDNIDPQYQCAKDLIASLPYLRSDITNLINKTFGVNSNIPLTFIDVPQSSLPSPTADAITDHFNISISRDVLSHASKEYILAVIFHEALHAFLNYERTRLGDSNFANLYPAIKIQPGTIGDKRFWFDNGPGVPVSYVDGDAQHRTMADYFMDKMADGIKALNPNIPVATLQAITRYGIFDDTNSTLNSNERNTTTGNSVGTKCP